MHIDSSIAVSGLPPSPPPPPRPPPDGFFAAFTPDVIARLVEALVSASDNAAEKHDEQIGSNATTFGFNLYHFAVHEFWERADGVTLAVPSRIPLFRALVGQRFELGCYKVGNSGGDDIWTSFPNNEHGAAGLVEPYLPGFEPTVTNATKVVLAYMANPEEGLCSAYLCVATCTIDNRISEWGFVHQIFRRDSEREVLADSAALHPDEEIGDFEVTRSPPAAANQNAAPEEDVSDLPLTRSSDDKKKNVDEKS